MWKLKWCFHSPHEEIIFSGNGRNMLDQYIRKGNEEDSFSSHFFCTICGKGNSQKNNVRNHVESIHFAGSFVYNCDHCDKSFNGKNSLSVHLSTYHRSLTKPKILRGTNILEQKWLFSMWSCSVFNSSLPKNITVTIKIITFRRSSCFEPTRGKGRKWTKKVFLLDLWQS